MKKRTLLLLLLLAIAIFAAVRWVGVPSSSLFQTNLIWIDTATVTAVSILPANDPQGEFFLKREGKTWIASQGNRSVKALYSAVSDLLKQLSRLDSHQLVSAEKKKWEDYGVGQGQGIRVRIYENGALLEDFVVGRREIGLEDSLAYSFVRLWADDEVFSVPGDLSQIWTGFDKYRSMALLDLDPSKIREIQWEPAGADTFLIFTDSLWGFLSGVSKLQGRSFADAFDPVSMSGALQGRLIFSGSEWDSPVEVRFYYDSLWEKPFIFYSTQNPDNYFFSDSADIYARLVQPVYSLPSPPPKDSVSQ